MNTAPRFRLGQLVGLPRICIRQQHSAKPKQPTIGFQGPEGHGEKIWVWGHRRQEQIIYSFRPQLSNHHGLKQLPFNGKKTKPAKLRKDYWSPIATIEFPSGQGSVGRAVYQKLRELKHLHEVAWDEDVRYKTEDEYTKEDKKRVQKAMEDGRSNYRVLRTVKERGWALNAQKKNAIADMAAVLAGWGPGNKISVKQTDAAEGELLPVTVNWANDQDKNYAEEWSVNVSHGLFEEPSYVSEATSTVLATKPAKAQPQSEPEPIAQ